MTTIMPNGFNDLDWPAPKNIRAGYTQKLSSKPLENNMARHTGEALDVVNQNRQQLKQSLNLSLEPAWVNQTHSTIVLNAKDVYDATDVLEADATYSNRINDVCVVMTADCLPVYICSKKGDEVAVVHAGWRGLVDGIIEKTIHKFQSPAQDLLVYLGPAISQNHFEVQKDLYELFVNDDQNAKHCFSKKDQQHWLANIYGLAKLRLSKLGVTDIYGANRCTYGEQSVFFSHRRAQEKGRMAHLIWIE